MTPYTLQAARTLLAVLCVSFGTAAGAVDRLDLPARPSSLAVDSLLLDLADTGARLVAVGERGHILFSDDRGRSWQQARVPARVTLTAVHFPTPERGWAVGHDGLVLHSADGGETWQKQLDGFGLNERVLAYREAQIAELEAALAVAEERGEQNVEELELQLDDARFALEDAQVAQQEGPGKPLLDLWFEDDLRGWVVGAYGLVLATRDGGMSWQPRMGALDNPDGFHFNAITGDGGALYLAGEQGLLFRSRDGGEQFERLESPYAGSLFAVTPVDGNLLLLGMRGHAYLSTDGGERWTPAETNTGSTLYGALDLPGERALVVGQRGTVLISDDGGRAFRAYTDPQRRGYLAAARGPGDEWLLVGQGGVRRLGLEQLVEVTP